MIERWRGGEQFSRAFLVFRGCMIGAYLYTSVEHVFRCLRFESKIETSSRSKLTKPNAS